MKLSSRGIAFIKQWEGLRLRAYRDGAGRWTIGYGHTGPDVNRYTVWSSAKVEMQLLIDIVPRESAIEKHVVVPLTQNQFDALVSFIYNVGVENFRISTLLKKINGRDFVGAQAQFPRWNKRIDPATGRHVVDKGLSNRREAERALFNERERERKELP